MHLDWKKTYESIIIKTSEITKIGVKDVEDIMDSFFEGMAYFLKLRTMPTFVVKDFFTIGPDPHIIKKKIRGSLKARNEKNEGRVKALISATWKVLKRLEAEKEKKYTFSLWKRLEARLLKKKYSKVLLGDVFSQITK